MPTSKFPWHDAFLNALREMPVLAHACDVVGIARSTAWRHMQADPDFNAEVEEAMEAGVDRAEKEAFRRGMTGYEEPVIDKGRLMYRQERYEVEDINGKKHEQWRMMLDEHGQPIPLTVRKHSDGLLSLVLKGRRKKVYSDRTEITGADGGALKLGDETARSARVAQLLALARERKIEADEFGDLA